MKNGTALTDPSDRAERRSARAVKIWHYRLLRQGMKRYVEAVLQELGDARAGACPMCNRPYRTNRAFRAVERALDRVLSRPDLTMQVVNLLGVDLETAQRAVSAYREVEGLDERAGAEYCLDAARKFYLTQGKRVVVLDDASAEVG